MSEIKYHSGRPVIPTAEESREASAAGASAMEALRRRGEKAFDKAVEDMLIVSIIHDIVRERELGNSQVPFNTKIPSAKKRNRLARRLRARGYRVSGALHHDQTFIISWWGG
jgi:hypothetical protein